MQNEKFQKGAFVFTRAQGLEPKDPETLLNLAQNHGIDEVFIPQYAGDRQALTRAIIRTQSGLSRKGFLLRPIKRTSTEVIYGIVREEKNEQDQKLEHDFEATVSWKVEPDPEKIEGDHPVASRVAQEYQVLRGKIVADDWSAAITTFLEGHDAARVRNDGRVYWIPPQRIEEVRRLGMLLQDVGIDLILCELEPEVHTVVQDVAQISIDDELERLQAEARVFDGTQRPSTYLRRLEEYQGLRERAILYRDALGLGVDKASEVLLALEQKVQAMLQTRRQTVIHRDGTKESKASTSRTTSTSNAEDTSELAGVTMMHFAGATFRKQDKEEQNELTFVSDDEAAKKATALLSASGLSGTWQSAAKVKFCITNSGPEGSAVSIRFKPQDHKALRASVPALALLGIEVSS